MCLPITNFVILLTYLIINMAAKYPDNVDLQMGRGARERFPNKTLDIGAVKAAKLTQLCQTKASHGGHFTRLYNEFLSKVHSTDIVTLNYLYDKLKLSHSVLKSDHDEFYTLARDLGEVGKMRLAEQYISEQSGRLRTAEQYLNEAQQNVELRTRRGVISRPDHSDPSDGLAPPVSPPGSDVESVLSKMSVLSRHSIQSVTSEAARAAARTQGLLAKAETLRKKRDLERRQFELAQESQRLELEAEIAQAQAEQNVLDDLIATTTALDSPIHHSGNHGNTFPDGNDSAMSFTDIAMDSHDCRGSQGFSRSLQPSDTPVKLPFTPHKYVKFRPTIKKTLFTPDIEIEPIS